jgi:hypothetical protein
MAEKKLAKSGKYNAAATWSPSGIPVAGDDVILEGAFTLTIDAAANCRSMKAAAGYTGKVVHTAGLVSVGNSEEPPEATALKFIAGMKYEPSAAMTIALVSTNATRLKVFAGGQTFATLQTGAATGKWKLEDELKAAKLSNTKGDIDCSSRTLELSTELLSSAEGTISLENATLKLTSAISVGETTVLNVDEKATVNGTGSTVETTGSGAGIKKLSAKGQTFGTLKLTNDCVVEQSMTVTTFALNAAGGAQGIALSENVVVTCSSLTTNAKAGSLCKLVSSPEGKPGKIKCSGAVNLDFLELKDNTAEGHTPFYAGTHSVNNGNVTNWNFEAEPVEGETRVRAGAELRRRLRRRR